MNERLSDRCCTFVYGSGAKPPERDTTQYSCISGDHDERPTYQVARNRIDMNQGISCSRLEREFKL